MNTHNKQASWGLPVLYKYAMIFKVEPPKFSENMTMKQCNELFEKRILTEIHKYAIFEVPSNPGYWKTTLPDSSRPDGRKHIKRKGYDRLCQEIIEYYIKELHLDMTMDTLFERWVIFRRDETSAKPGTVRKDMSLYRTHCQKLTIDGIPLGSWKVSELTPKKLYSFFRKLTKDRAYSRHAVNNIRGVLSGMLAYAVEKDIIQSNPAKDIDLKRLSFKPEKDKRDDVFSKEEAQKLLTHLAPIDEPYALAIRLDFNLFARIGEIEGLKWENVDIENRCIHICNQLTYEPELNDDLTFSEKKMVPEDYLKGCTAEGYRDEYITDEALEILEKARNINPDGEYVFMPNGRPIITLTFNKRLKKYCKDAGVPYHSSHKIRFYAASTAYDGENLASISRMMGHKHLSTTLHYLRDVDQSNDCSDVFRNLGRQTS